MRMHLRSVCLGLLLLAGLGGAVRAADESLWDRTRLQYPPMREIKLPDVQRKVLANGMVVYILEDHDFPVVGGRLLIRVGGMLDPADKVGLARMTGQVLRTGGSQGYPGDELDKKLENMGAQIEFWIGSIEGNGNFWCLRENAPEILTILADLLRRPALSEEKLNLAKVDLRQEIASRNDEPDGIAFREMRSIVWGKDHPYARLIEYATVDAVTRDDLVEFHKRSFFPDRISLTIWGDFDAKKIYAQLDKLFGDWKASGEPAPALPPPAKIVPGGSLSYAEKQGMTNAWAVTGHIGLKADSPDYAAMNVLGEVLGGGFSGRLLNEIRSKRGLAYDTYATSGTDFPRPGVFLAWAATRSDSVLVSLDLLRKEIRRVTEEPVTEVELTQAKDAILNSDVFQYASKGQIAARMAYLDFYRYPTDFTARYPEEVRKVTAQSLLAAARRNIHPDDLQMLLVGDQKDFAAPVASLGKYETVDLTIPQPVSKVAVPAATPEALAHGQKLLARAAQATGGSAAWASLRDLTQDADLVATVQGMSLSIALHSVRTAAGQDYVSQKLPFGEIIVVRDGEAGWKKSPRGVGDLTTDEIKEVLQDRARDFWSLFGKPSAYQAQALKPEQVDGKNCDVVLLSGGGLDQVFLYLDAASGRPVQMRYQGKAPQGGPAEALEIYDDYRSVGPVTLPFSIRTLYDGQPFATGVVKSAVANGGVDAKIFAKPGP